MSTHKPNLYTYVLEMEKDGQSLVFSTANRYPSREHAMSAGEDKGEDLICDDPRIESMWMTIFCRGKPLRGLENVPIYGGEADERIRGE